jgi:3-methylfumaryl-CoA hydratase
VTIADWIGKTESHVDSVTAAPLAALSATLDRDDPPPRIGDAVPLLWHWLYFLPVHRQSELGEDGHARLGGFLPPVPRSRRMYAGGRVDVHGALRVGDTIERVSTIAGVTEKEGRKGRLVFVKVQHRISNGAGLALVEDHDIVYVESEADRSRPAEAGGGSATRTSARSHAGDRGGTAESHRSGQSAPAAQAASSGSWIREIRPDDVLLFRYSALTFNGYRPHYDRRFATEVQHYPGLVVHAPLIATLLADLIRRNLPSAVVSTFTFRASRPLFDGTPFLVCGRPEADGRRVELWAQDRDGVAFQATAALKETPGFS